MTNDHLFIALLWFGSVGALLAFGGALAEYLSRREMRKWDEARSHDRV
jgi:hypothetical protein